MVTFSNRNLSPFWISLRVIGTGSSGAFNWRWQFPATNFFWYWNKNNTGSRLDCVGENYICKSEYFSLLTFCAKSRLDWSRTLRTWYELSALLLRKFLESTPLDLSTANSLTQTQRGCQAKFRRFCSCPLTSIDDLKRLGGPTGIFCQALFVMAGKRTKVTLGRPYKYALCPQLVIFDTRGPSEQTAWNAPSKHFADKF